MKERFYKMVKEIYEMGLKKGDLVQITFTDGEVVEGKMNTIRYAESWGRTYQHYMKLEYKKADGDIYVSDTDNIEKVDFNKSKNIMIASVILVAGIGGLTLKFGDPTNPTIQITSVAVAMILGIVLNLTLREKNTAKAE